MKLYKISYFYAFILVLFVGLLCRWIFIDVYVVIDPLMEPNVSQGSKVFALSYIPSLKKKLQRKKLVVYKQTPNSPNKLSRIVALGGDQISLPDYQLMLSKQEIQLNSSPIGESYLVKPRFYSPVYLVPKKGQEVFFDSLSLRETDMLLNIIKQSKPYLHYDSYVSLFIDNKKSTAKDLKKYIDLNILFVEDFDFTSLSWYSLLNIEKQLKLRFPYQDFSFKRDLLLNDSVVSSFVVPQECFFVIDDNFEQGIDSRYFGPICESQIQSIPFYIH